MKDCRQKTQMPWLRNPFFLLIFPSETKWLTRVAPVARGRAPYSPSPRPPPPPWSKRPCFESLEERSDASNSTLKRTFYKSSSTVESCKILPNPRFYPPPWHPWTQTLKPLWDSISPRDPCCFHQLLMSPNFRQCIVSFFIHPKNLYP